MPAGMRNRVLRGLRWRNPRLVPECAPLLLQRRLGMLLACTWLLASQQGPPTTSFDRRVVPLGSF
jgi:hypothetical protein